MRKTEQRAGRVVLVYWGRRGGGSLLTLRMAKRLAQELGPSNVAISLSTRNEDSKEFAGLNLELLEMGIPSAADLLLKFPATIRDLSLHAARIEGLHPDLVVFTMNFPLAWPFIGFLQRRNIKVAFTAHDARPHPGDYATLWQSVTQKLIVSRADSIIALSHFVGRELSAQVGKRPAPVHVIPLEGFYASRTSSALAQTAGGRPVRLLFAGRLLRYKGMETLARALDPLRTRSDWVLTIAGHGPAAAEVRSSFADWPQVDLRIGWLSQTDFESALCNHDALLCPYTEASQSGVIAEALTFGMPSLVMPNGALPEQVGYGLAGLVAQEASSDGFRAIVTQVLDNPLLLQSLSEGARQLLTERQPDHLWRALNDGSRLY